MKTKYFIILSILFVGSVIITGNILAQETSGLENIIYPVQELNNCKDEADCRAYCDLPENITTCVDFGETNGLLSKEEAALAKKFIAAGANGPGGCQSKNECETYCDNIANIDECIEFGEKNNMIPPEELEEARKVQAAIKRGVKPPKCGSKSSCDIYCEAPENMEKCIAFGVEAGFIQGKELEDAQKMISAIKRGVRPPPCRGKEACDVYCSSPDNMELCMNFAIEAGFMSEQEIADSQKMLSAIKQGVKPPNCRGKEECDAYCSSEEHFDECTNFAEAAGFMSAEEAIMARKTKGKSPGNCKGKEECEAFCNNPDNQETCFNFAKENGLISEEELQKMEEGKNQFRESLNQMPPEVLECVISLLGQDVVEKIKSGELSPSKELGDKMSECFKQMGPPPGEQFGEFQNGNNMMPPNGQFQQTGPGGCSSPEECRAFCESNPQDCQNMPPPQNMPNELTSPPPPPTGPIPMPYPNDNPNLPNNLQLPPGIDCSSPEECQQIIQEQMANQIQQQFVPPEGQYQPPPDGQFQSPPDGQYQQYPTDQTNTQPPPDEQPTEPPPPPAQ